MSTSLRKVFVTVGTTRFDELCDAIFSEEIIKLLQQLGYNFMTVQVGNSAVELHNRKLFGMYVQSYRFKDDITEDMSNACLIISHAGAGSCLEALDLRKPLVVVVNTDLMDNHQLEIAEQLNISGHLYYCTCNSLASTLENVDLNMLKPCREADTTSFYNYLNRYLGL